MKSFPTILLIIAYTNAFTSTSTQRRRILPQQQQQPICNNNGPIVTRLQSSSASSSSSKPEQSKAQALPPPSTFREAEVAGLRLMQDGRHEEALKAFQKAMSLPGSRPDILRTANVPGPSPVGGSKGGTQDRFVQNLDEFEFQAAHYNVACAHACLGNVGDAVNNLQNAFEYGFDNFATVRADPDLGNLEGTREFDALMKKWDPKSRGIMGLFGK
mmetsp:Transcript_35702/g.73002  ORF Transcript_35702/g.73002 Transcript_35702/m.73002 type:complete len:215 (+) Transcript_35702:101-745(+)